MTRPVFYPTRRGGRVVECGGLENRLACIRSRGFESLLLRQFEFRASSDGSFFCYRTRPVQKQEEGFEPVEVLSCKRASVCSSARKARRRRSAPGAEAPRTSLLLRQFICVPVALKVFDGAIVFKPHIVKVSLAGHGVGRTNGICSRGLNGYLAVGC